MLRNNIYQQMAEGDRGPEDDRFEEILRLEGHNIRAFHQEGTETFFPNATHYPEFFNQNLVNPNRVIKQFINDPQSNIRIFYLQLLRLAFEIPSETGYHHVCLQNLKRIVFHPEFEILFTPDTEPNRDVYNDFQFKKLFAEFVSLLISASEVQPPNMEQALCEFPIMDDVMIHIIRSLLVSFNIRAAFDEKIPSDLLFKEMSSLLQLSLTSYGNCWKFEESDMFCYEENDNQLYLAYILDDYQVEENQNLQQIESQREESRTCESTFITSATVKQGDGYSRFQSNNNGEEWAREENYKIQIGAQTEQVTSNTRFSEPLPPSPYLTAIDPFRDNFMHNQIPSQRSHFQGEDSNIETFFEKIEGTLNSIKNQNAHPNSNVQNDRQSRSAKTTTPPNSYQSVQHNYTPTINNFYQAPPAHNYNPPSYFEPTKYQPPTTYSSSFTTQTRDFGLSGLHGTDYNQDFTPPEILAKLRPQHRQNILRIKEYFHLLRRGGPLPPNFDLNSTVTRNTPPINGYYSHNNYSSTGNSKISGNLGYSRSYQP